jgi:uncharacterized membrane protein YfcA
VDRDNAGLLNDFGQVNPVLPLNGVNSPASLFFDPKLTPSDISLIRKDDIRYIVTDTRLTEGLPLFGAYVAPGETAQPTRLTAAELEKFNSIPGVYRIYDNGAIQVYDLSVLLGERPLAVPTHSVSSIRTTGTDLGVLVLAILVAIAWLFRLRRRMKLNRVDEHMVVCWIVGAMAVGLFGVFAILLIHLPPGPVAIFSLLVLLALGLWAARRERHPWPNVHRHKESLLVPAESTAEPDGQDSWLDTQLALVGEWSQRMNQRIESAVARIEVSGSGPALESPRPPPGGAHRARSQFVLGCIGLALFAAGASVAVAAAQKEWVPPAELSIAMRHGQVQRTVASVDLGTAAPISAHLEVVTGGRVLWSAPLSSNSGTQNLVLPYDVLQPPSRVLVVAGGRTIRSVGG